MKAAPSRRIASALTAGMLDWPGKVAATLFLSGCGFRCPFCHNAALLSTEAERPAIDWREFVGHLRTKRAWLDGVVVTGGEPTDDPDLPALLTALAEEGFDVKLDTNGSRPRVLRHLLAEDLLSYVALDVKTVWERYSCLGAPPPAAERVLESARILIRSGVAHEFRTTAFPGVVALDDFTRIASALSGGMLYAVQQFRAKETLDPLARDVRPYTPEELRDAASRCRAFLPTIVRGAGS